jgi:hypothetical protein
MAHLPIWNHVEHRRLRSQMAQRDSQPCAARQNCAVVALSREIEMKQAALALVLFTSPALAQTPNLAGAPPASNVPNPVVCLPIGKTAKGDLVYAMDCRDIPVEKTAMPPVVPTVPPSATPAAPPAAPESK